MTCIKTVEVRVPDRVTAVEVRIPGIPGAQGLSGSGLSFTHNQPTISSTWTVPHNLGYRPTVSVTTSGGVEVDGGEIVHLSNNTLQILFDDSFSGFARCT